MVESSIQAWGLLFALILSSSLAGLVISARLPWSDLAVQSHVDRAFGIALAPFLAGAAVTLALLVCPEGSHRQHLFISAAILALLSLTGLIRGRIQAATHSCTHRHQGTGNLILAFVLLLWVTALLFNASFLPLTQNDALEYGLVGRELFSTRSLAAYPVLNSDTNISGFYGPWTHPPLYVALIYIAYVIQGHADQPGLMRLIAPWFALSTIYLTFSLGSFRSRQTGLFAALILFAAPLFFFGADSALIDALPMLGFMLVISVIIGCRPDDARFSIVVGCVLGLSLWTHSQALLFVPLAILAILMRRAADFRKGTVVRNILIAVGLAAAIAAWPYLRNISLFGALVSDNPAVFALPQLAWKDYFTIGRGLDHWISVIQYGWLKGWFAPEAYGLAFWLMLLVPLTKLVEQRSRATVEAVSERSADAQSLMRILISVVICYLVGVVVSTALGIDLMIKNERYMLAILPMVALLAAESISRLAHVTTSRLSGAWQSRALYFVIASFALVWLLNLAMLERYRLSANDLSPNYSSRHDAQFLKDYPQLRIIESINTHTPENSVILSLKPADMYYAKRRMVSYLDPRLLPFYRTQELGHALRELTALGITHIQAVDYGLPVMNNSVLQKLMSDVDLTALITQSDGNQLYQLRPSARISGPTHDLLSGNVTWYRATEFVLGGRKALLGMESNLEPYEPTRLSKAKHAGGLFHRSITTRLTAGYCGAEAETAGCHNRIAVQGGREFLISLGFEGHGHIRVLLEQFQNNKPIKDPYLKSQHNILLGEVILGGDYKHRKFVRRFEMHPETTRIVLNVEHVGASSVMLHQAAVTELLPK